MKKLLSQVDLWLGRIVTAFMLPLFYLIFAALTAVMLFFIGTRIFEYEFSLSDVDRLELLLISLVLLTSYRLFYRGRRLGWSYWRLLKRFCFVTSTVFLMASFIFGMFVIVELVEAGKVMADALYQHNDALLFILGTVLILAMYAAAPLPSLFKPKEVIEDSKLERINDVSSELINDSSDEIADPWSPKNSPQKG